MLKIFKYIKFFFIFIISTVCLIFFLFLVDATDIDNNYINRSIFNTSYVHLNSRHSFAFANYLKKNYFLIQKKLFNKSYKERWSIESKDDRLKLPKYKKIKAKENNFSETKYNLFDYNNYESWTRSHGNNFSTRFSSLKKINLENAKDLKLAWVYEPESILNSKKENQANIIYFNGKVFFPDVENNLVSLNAENGEVFWKYKIEDGIAAKRGLVLFKKEKKKPGRLIFTDNRKYLYSINTDGKPTKGFGVNGRVKIGLTPLTPVIYKDQIIVVTTDNIIKSYDLNDGKINWKFKVNKTKDNILYSNFSKGSPWGGLSLDKKRGLLFFTTGNPEPWHVGVYRKGDNLYANSIVSFNLNTKKIEWHFQEIPHDVWNYDLAAPPILTMIKRNNHNVDAVVAVSKLGNVIVLDRETGEPLFDINYRLAPTSNIPGERTANYQIDINLPEKICRSEFKKDLITDFDLEFKNTFLKEINEYNFGYPSPPLIGKKTLSIGGCVRWAGGSVDTKKNILYISSDNPGIDIITIQKDTESLNYYHEWDTLLDNNGLPAIKPPWGSITALNLNSGKIIWTKPFGKLKNLEKENIYNTGSFNRAGITATSGGIIFASGTEDKLFRIYDSRNGDEIWNYQMDAAGSAPPTTFMYKENQYVIVPAYEKEGNKVYAFSLK